MARKRLTILVSGMIAGVPWQGGATWAVLQYLLGFRRLGHDVYLVEELQASAVQPPGSALAGSTNATYFRRVMEEHGLVEQSALLLSGTSETVGLSYERLRHVAQRADVLVNIAGTLTDEAITAKIPARLYLDLDPAFTQLWHAVDGIDMRFSGHTHFATVGQAIGRNDCVVPTCGLPWIPTPQPIVLKHWPACERITHDALTSVANWRGYGSIEYRGVFYGQKAHSLREFIALPTRTSQQFLLALTIHPDERRDLASLRANRWRLTDPTHVAGTPDDYRQFIQGSKAEIGIAKKGYAASRCAWFSDRSICYLASGRPVIAQETGFSDFFPTGEGLLTFETTDTALASVEALNADYPRHARAARAIAEECFESGKVLGRLLQHIGASG
jgi:hypothetical protein